MLKKNKMKKKKRVGGAIYQPKTKGSTTTHTVKIKKEMGDVDLKKKRQRKMKKEQEEEGKTNPRQRHPHKAPPPVTVAAPVQQISTCSKRCVSLPRGAGKALKGRRE